VSTSNRANIHQKASSATTWLSDPAMRDLVISVAGFFVLFWLAQRIELVEQLHNLTRQHEEWELDEFLLVFLVSPIFLGWFAVRRWQESRVELQRRQRREQQLQERTLELENTLKKLQDTQSQLIQQEKMSSLGQLVAGIAHEINNPINFITGNIACATEYTQDLLLRRKPSIWIALLSTFATMV